MPAPKLFCVYVYAEPANGIAAAILAYDRAVKAMARSVITYARGTLPPVT